MDRITRMLAGLLGRSAGLLPAARREWAEAVLAEAGEVPAGSARVAWLGGGVWMVAREVVLGTVIRALAFTAGAVGLAWVGWPGASSNSATLLNRVYVTGTVVLLAVLPWVVRRYFGPARGGWAPRAARAGGYAMVLALIAAKAVKDRDGSKLGAYFPVIPPVWALQILLLLVIAGYLAGLLILTSQRIRLTCTALPIGIGLGAATAGVLYALAPLGPGFIPFFPLDPESSLGSLWGLVSLALPLATGFLAARLATRDTRPGVPNPIRQGCLAASCATATGALVLAVLTSATIALFPHHVPLQNPPPPPGGGCETCDPGNTGIPPGLRHEYWVELSIGQAGQAPLVALLLAPFLGAGLGALGGGLAGKSPGTRGHGGGGPHAASRPAPSQPLAGRVSDADREQVIGVLKVAFVQGRLIKDELDARAGHALTAPTRADLAGLTTDLRQYPRPG
jgi:hypothetical protein